MQPATEAAASNRSRNQQLKLQPATEATVSNEAAASKRSSSQEKKL
jgi:hypothetical protein